MKIASYVNTCGAVAGLHEKGRICLYEKSAEGWSSVKEIPLDVNTDMPLSNIKADITHAIAQLDDCKVFIVNGFGGLFHAVLKEECGFRTWMSEGSLLEQLDSVARHDHDFVAAQAARSTTDHICSAPTSRSGCGGGCSSHSPGSFTDLPESGKPLPVPQSLGDGCYRINLAKILNNDASLNSKQVLVPFMAGVAFKRLEVLCDHAPRWFDRELHKLNLTVASEQPGSTGKGVKVLVVPVKAEAVQHD